MVRRGVRQAQPRATGDGVGKRHRRIGRHDDVRLSHDATLGKHVAVSEAVFGEEEERDCTLAAREGGGDDGRSGLRGSVRMRREGHRRRGGDGGDGEVEDGDVRGDDDGEHGGGPRDPRDVENRAGDAVDGPFLGSHAQAIGHLALPAEGENLAPRKSGDGQSRVVGGIEEDPRHLEFDGASREWTHAHLLVRGGGSRGSAADGSGTAESRERTGVEHAHLIALGDGEKTGAPRTTQSRSSQGAHRDGGLQFRGGGVFRPRTNLERSRLEAATQMDEVRSRRGGQLPRRGKRQSRRRRRRRKREGRRKREKRDGCRITAALRRGGSRARAQTVHQTFAQRRQRRRQRARENLSLQRRHRLRRAQLRGRDGSTVLVVLGAHDGKIFVVVVLAVVQLEFAVALLRHGYRAGGSSAAARGGGHGRRRFNSGGDGVIIIIRRRRRRRRASRGEASTLRAVNTPRAAIAEKSRFARIHNLVSAVARPRARRAAPLGHGQVARVAKVPVLLHE